jgi:hypothetical protein
MALTFPVSGYRSLATGYADVRTALGDVGVFWRHCVGALAVRTGNMIRACRSAHSVVAALTTNTEAKALSNAQIVAGKRMSVNAVGLRAVFAANAFAAPQVFLNRYGFKMIWIAAVSVAAQVINLQISRDRPFKDRVRVAMGEPRDIVSAGLAISIWPEIASPVPTLTGWNCLAACLGKGVKIHSSHSYNVLRPRISFKRSVA